MLKLVYCEFLKLKRKKFIFLTIFAAALFPIPMTTFAAKSNLGFDWLYLNIEVFGYFLLLPTVLGILGAILFFSEKTNGTQKNINTIPISTAVLNNGGFLRIPMKQSLTRKPLRLYRKSVPENAALPKWGICLCSLVCSTVQIAEAK